MDLRSIVSGFEKYGLSLNPKAVSAVMSQLKAEEQPDIALSEIVQNVVDLVAQENYENSVVTKEVIIKVVAKLSKTSKEISNDSIQVFDAHILPIVEYNTVERRFYYRNIKDIDVPPSTFANINRLNLIEKDLQSQNLFSKGMFNSEGTLSLKKIDTAKGNPGKVLLVGMITTHSDSKLYLESETSSIEIDFTQATALEIFVFAGAVALIEGEIDDSDILHVFLVASVPLPSETICPQDTMRFLLPQDEFDYHLTNNKLMNSLEAENDDSFLVCSNLEIDIKENREDFEKLLKQVISTGTIPKLLIILGNLSSQKVRNYMEYKEQLRLFAEFVSQKCFSPLFKQCKISFVPGERDFTPEEDVLPADRTVEACTKSFETVVERNSSFIKYHFGTNPSNILFYSKRLVFFKHNLMRQFIKQSISLEEKVSDDKFAKMARTILEQRHLLPFQLCDTIVASSFASGLQLFPSPHALFIADEDVDGYYEHQNTVVIGVPSFSRTSKLLIYKPSSNKVSTLSQTQQ